MRIATGRIGSAFFLAFLGVSLVAFPQSASFLHLSQTAASQSGIQSSSQTTDLGSGDPSTGLVFVWYFGYSCNSFIPQNELNLSPTTLLEEASKLSSSVGGPSHLALISPIDEVRGCQVTESSFAAERSYVEGLRRSAILVFGRLDLDQFNVNTNPTIYEEASMYVHELDLNGIWLDHASEYYGVVGQQSFNSIMQKLTTAFPGVRFMLNNGADASKVTVPTVGTTWSKSTYASPTVIFGTDNAIPSYLISVLNKYFPGRVVLHLDSFATVPNEPMGIFANQVSAVEVSTVSSLAATGLSPKHPGEGFNFLFPVIGAATEASSIWGGTLYNSLHEGLNDRSTITGFIRPMEEEA